MLAYVCARSIEEHNEERYVVVMTKMVLLDHSSFGRVNEKCWWREKRMNISK